MAWLSSHVNKCSLPRGERVAGGNVWFGPALLSCVTVLTLRAELGQAFMGKQLPSKVGWPTRF